VRIELVRPDAPISVEESDGQTRYLAIVDDAVEWLTLDEIAILIEFDLESAF
jgi:hypothetical protein